MDATTQHASQIATRTAGTGQSPWDRMPGERFWWIDAEARVGIASAPGGVDPDPRAWGRVCLDARIGVIEGLGGSDASLSCLPREFVDLLGSVFPGVRWALSDPPVRRALGSTPITMAR